VQQVTGETVKMASADQGYTGQQALGDAAQNGIELRRRAKVCSIRFAAHAAIFIHGS
jgi:hypothetical protein